MLAFCAPQNFSYIAYYIYIYVYTLTHMCTENPTKHQSPNAHIRKHKGMKIDTVRIQICTCIYYMQTHIYA